MEHQVKIVHQVLLDPLLRKSGRICTVPCSLKDSLMTDSSLALL